MSNILENKLNNELQCLLQHIHNTATESAIYESCSLQTFSSLLGRWLEDRDDSSDPTSCIRSALRKFQGMPTSARREAIYKYRRS
jgi:hypothetical protein